MPSVVRASITIVDAPRDHMCSSGKDLVITSRTPVGLGGACARDWSHLVLVAVRANFDPTRHSRHRCIDRSGSSRSTTRHQNSRNSSLSIPRIES